MSKAWFQSRYDKGETEEERTAYLNCAMDRAGYEQFVDALLAAPKTEFQRLGEARRTAGETPYFEGCLPIEVMAERGRETLRFGPLKPVGLTNPHSAQRPHAVVQLRRENRLGTLYNLVGFQTKMRYGAQAEVFALIPGLENARWARLGGIHRNTFLNSPRLLDPLMRLARRSRGCASPARSPVSRAMSSRAPWACWPAALPRWSGWAAPPSRRRRRRPSGRCSRTSRAGPKPRRSSR